MSSLEWSGASNGNSSVYHSADTRLRPFDELIIC